MSGEVMIRCKCVQRQPLFVVNNFGDVSRPEVKLEGRWMARKMKSRHTTLESFQKYEQYHALFCPVHFSQLTFDEIAEAIGYWIISGTCSNCNSHFSIKSTMSHQEWEKNPLSLLEGIESERNFKLCFQPLVKICDWSFNYTEVAIEGKIDIRRNLLDKPLPNVFVDWIPSIRGRQNLSLSSVVRRRFFEQCRSSVLVGILEPSQYPDWFYNGQDDDFMRWAEEVWRIRIQFMKDQGIILPPEQLNSSRMPKNMDAWLEAREKRTAQSVEELKRRRRDIAHQANTTTFQSQ